MKNNIFENIDISTLNKDNILDIFLTKNKKQICAAYVQKKFLIKFDNLYTFMYTYFDDISEDDTVITVLYRIVNNITINPKCPVCGNRLKVVKFNKGFQHFCSKQCINRSEEIRNKINNTNIKKYGVINAAQSSIVKSKIINTNIKKYGVKYGVQSDIIKDKIRITTMYKYNVTWPSQIPIVIEKVKNTVYEKYGVYNCQQNKDINNKGLNTKLKNKTFSSSSIECEFYKYLCSIFDNVYKQYKTDEYPFNCDFYIYDIQLYIEIQGSWTHGRHPYNTYNINDINIVNKWNSKYINENKLWYKDAIDVWTIRDVNKRNTAISNNLNYLEIFTCKIENAIDALNKYITENKKYNVFIYDK